MAKSQNGWPVLTTAPSYKLKWITGRVLPGDVATIFEHLGRRFNDEVEPINPAHSWGWANRNIAGSSSVSNHASATAVDFNAPKHPLGKANTFTQAQQATIRAILRELDGVVRWGGDYSGRKDDMHFEINANAAAVAKVAAKLRGSAVVDPEPNPAPAKENTKMKTLNLSKVSAAANTQLSGQHVLQLQGLLNAGSQKVDFDGWAGPATKAAVVNFQRAHGLDQDAVVGANTWAKLLDI
jgi:hypothetical protein